MAAGTDVSEPAASAVAPRANWRAVLQPYIPKSVVCLREGYSRHQVLNDLLAGATVGVIALPLAMALAIASGATPERGLYTAVIAGFLISLLSGSRVQIGGPTGAFVVIVYGVLQRHGYEGLVIATFMAGVILIIMGLARFGTLIKFIPYPVTTGFTAGIALIIFSSQMRDFFGLQMEMVPAEFIEKWHALLAAARTFNPYTLAIALGSLGVIIAVRKTVPRVPGAIIAVVFASALVAIFSLDAPRFGVETIGTRFASPAIPSGIPRALPAPQLPPLNWATLQRARELVPEATTIALLAGIESLLCCVVADGMIGGRHKSNCELVAQGAANIGAIIFGGIPATGAIARTAANVKNGGRTPLAGIVHAITILLLMLLLAPYASRIPLASLAAILVLVAWDMSELDHFRTLLRAPRSDVVVLVTTFGLTVLTDLTIAVGVGMVLAALLFMRRMSEVTNLSAIKEEPEEAAEALHEAGDPNAIARRDVPASVEVYEINGPFFFGVADLLKDVLRGVERPPRVFILRIRRVTVIDATGIHALDEFLDKCRRQGTTLLLAGVHAQPMFALTRYGLLDKVGQENLFGNIDDALDHARMIVGQAPLPRPTGAVPEVARERNVKQQVKAKS